MLDRGSMLWEERRMSMRLMHVTLPKSAKEAMQTFVDSKELSGVWVENLDDAMLGYNLLIEAESGEPVMDGLQKQFSKEPGFQLVLLPVDVVLPRPEQKGHTSGRISGKVGRISREELYAEVAAGAVITPVYLAMLSLSVVVAAIGVTLNDVPVIIGAMVIAPLLGPNVALALATTLGDLDLVKVTGKATLIGVLLVLALSALFGVLVPFDPATPSIASRTSAGLSDVAVALAAGAAGTLALTSSQLGAVIGVAVAVSLVPPLVVAGLLFGAGLPFLALGALHLAGLNIVCINLAGVTTFLLRGVRPNTWWEAKRARIATRYAMTFWLLVALLILIFHIFRP